MLSNFVRVGRGGGKNAISLRLFFRSQMSPALKDCSDPVKKRNHFDHGVKHFTFEIVTSACPRRRPLCKQPAPNAALLVPVVREEASRLGRRRTRLHTFGSTRTPGAKQSTEAAQVEFAKRWVRVGQ